MPGTKVPRLGQSIRRSDVGRMMRRCLEQTKVVCLPLQTVRCHILMAEYLFIAGEDQDVVHTDEEEVDKTEEPVTEGDGGEPAVSETLVCLSTRCTRAMVKARKRSYDEYLKNFSDVLENLNSKYESMLQKEAFFKFNWDKRIAELRAQTKFGGFN